MDTRTIGALFTLLLYGITSAATTIPFRLVKHNLVIQATVNGIPGYFILDTGTRELVLNNRNFEGVNTGKFLVGINGEKVPFHQKEVNLVIGDQEWNRVNAHLLPLDHLCQTKGFNVLGLIGAGLLRQFTLTIDFDDSELILRKGKNKTEAENFYPVPAASLPLLWRGGIPVIQALVGDEKLFLGLDTGAGINVINEQKKKRLAGHLSLQNTVKVLGINGQSKQKLQKGQIHELQMGGYACPTMNVAFVPMGQFKGICSQLNLLDGFIGYEFLQHFRTVIDFRRGRVDLYPRQGGNQRYWVARESGQ